MNAAAISDDQRERRRVLPFVPHGGLTFGIYHGGVVETSHELATGKPDSPDEVNRALDHLQSGKHLLVRTFLHYTGSEADNAMKEMPSVAELARYTWNGRKLDLVLSNWDGTRNISRWCSFISQCIERYGEYVENLQICEEPNNFEYPGDGRFPNSVDAVVTGVYMAREVIQRRGLKIAIGFNAVPSSVVNDSFWSGMQKHTNQRFLNALDYVGVNLYLDTAEPITGEIEGAVEERLTNFRNVSLEGAGIPKVIPVHVSESGWPTGPQRFYTRQSEMLRRVVRKTYEMRQALNITQFELFCLRDADTGNPQVSQQFGIMRDDYRPKPAFDTFRDLIQEFGSE